jgi:hypothetical protein
VKVTLGEHVRVATASLDAVEPALRAGEALTALRHAFDARDETDALITYLAARARLDGASWTQVGAQLGVSKQAVQQRYTAAADALLRAAIRAGARQRPLTTGPQPIGERCGRWCRNGNASSSDHPSGGTPLVRGRHCYCLCHDHTPCGHRHDDDRYGIIRVQTHPEFFHHDAREETRQDPGGAADDDAGAGGVEDGLEAGVDRVSGGAR